MRALRRARTRTPGRASAIWAPFYRIWSVGAATDCYSWYWQVYDFSVRTTPKCSYMACVCNNFFILFLYFFGVLIARDVYASPTTTTKKARKSTATTTTTTFIYIYCTGPFHERMNHRKIKTLKRMPSYSHSMLCLYLCVSLSPSLWPSAQSVNQSGGFFFLILLYLLFATEITHKYRSMQNSI